MKYFKNIYSNTIMIINIFYLKIPVKLLSISFFKIKKETNDEIDDDDIGIHYL